MCVCTRYIRNKQAKLSFTLLCFSTKNFLCLSVAQCYFVFFVTNFAYCLSFISIRALLPKLSLHTEIICMQTLTLPLFCSFLCHRYYCTKPITLPSIKYRFTNAMCARLFTYHHDLRVKSTICSILNGLRRSLSLRKHSKYNTAHPVNKARISSSSR